MKLDLDNGFLLKLVCTFAGLVIAYATLFFKIEAIEKELAKNDREQIMIEFRLLQQQVTAQDEDLSEVMKVVNKIMFDVEKIKTRIEIIH